MAKNNSALDDVLDMEKSAFMGKVLNYAKNNTGDLKDMGKTMATMVGATALPLMAINRLKKKIQNDTRRKALIEDLYMNDPIIKDAEREDVLQYYATIYSVAPSVSLDKNVVRELLQNFVKFGRVDIQTIKTLAETEEKMSKGNQNSFKATDALRMMG